MKPIKNYDKIQASGDFERLPAGGYVARIQSAKDDHPQGESENSMLRIVFDIAEGPEAGRYKDEPAENDFRHSFIRSYKEKALGMFKAFTEALEASNPGYKWDWNEAALKGKLIGLIIGYEEYNANDGSVKERMRIVSCISAEKVRKGDFRIPEVKKLEAKAPSSGPVPGFTPMADADIPF